MPSKSVTFRALILSGAAALALAGCREDEAPQARQEPLFVPAATEAAYGLPLAPAAEALPPAPPAPVRVAAQDQGYAYAERAYALDNAFYEVPPDYGFSYQDANPWAWRTADDYQMYAEPVSGGFRYYYYEPGADYPYFVRDPDYGYGYAPGGVLVSLYSSAGALMPRAYVRDYAERAGRYRVRARDLRQAAYHRPHVPVAREAWLSRRPSFVASQGRWREAAVRQPEWRSYRDRHDDREVRRFLPERERRAAEVARFDRAEVRQAVERRDDRHDDSRANQAVRARAEQARRAEAERVQTERLRAERGQGRQDWGEGRQRQGDQARVERVRQDQARQQQADQRRAEAAQRAEAFRQQRASRPDRIPDQAAAQRAQQVEAARQQRAERPDRGEGDRQRLERRAALEQRPDRGPRPERQPPAQQERPDRRAELAGRQRPERPAPAPQQARQERPDQPQGARPGGERRGGERGGERGGGRRMQEN